MTRHWKTAVTAIALVAVGFLTWFPNPSRAQSAATLPFAGADPFLQKNCVACHNSSAPAARLDLTKLGYEPANPDNFATWVKIHDRVHSGEMPPKDVERPTPADAAAFVKSLTLSLTTLSRVRWPRGPAGSRPLCAW